MKLRSLPLISGLLLVTSMAWAQAPRPAVAPAPTSVPATPLVPVPAGKPAPDLQLLKGGAMAPDFESRDRSGKAVKLSDFRGKVVVLDFWATWCGPCRASLPHTEEVANRYKNQRLVVLAVCTSDTRTSFESWVKSDGEKYPNILFTSDPHERGSVTYDQRASRKLYGVSGIPTQFVMDRAGRVVTSIVGYEKGDVRLEVALAKAGLQVEPATGGQSEAQRNPVGEENSDGDP